MTKEAEAILASGWRKCSQLQESMILNKIDPRGLIYLARRKRLSRFAAEANARARLNQHINYRPEREK